jgi:hypothetical protein
MIRNKAKQVHQGVVIMKKIVVCLALFSLLCSCENLVTDLPTTNTSQFISGTTVVFPKGTKAIDIYNTVVSLCPDNEWYDVTNGSWKYVKSTTTTMTSKGPVTTESYGSVGFSRIKRIHTSTDPEVNTHTIYLDSSYPADYPFSHSTNIRDIVFKWQRQTTNVWQNDAIEGEITFQF